MVQVKLLLVRVDYERQVLLPQSACVGCALDDFLAYIAPFGSRDTIELLQVEVQGEVVGKLATAFRDAEQVAH